MLHTFACGDPLDFESAVLGANPSYGAGPEYRRNCQRCVIAFEMRRRGYAVTAMPNPFPTRSGTYSSPSFSGSECFIGPEKHLFIGAYPDLGSMREEFIEHMASLPVNSRWAISWLYPDQKLSHIIIGERQETDFIYADPQSGKIGISTLQLANPVYGYKYFRMDNLCPRENFEWGDVIKREAAKWTQKKPDKRSGITFRFM